MMGYAVPLLGRLPGLDRVLFTIMLARFSRSAHAPGCSVIRSTVRMPTRS